MANFEVGKKVIAIGNHSQGKFRKGDVFILDGIKKSHCTCKPFVLDIGIKSEYPFSRCPICDYRYVSDSVWWVGSNYFAPYDDSLSELTAEDILNEQTVTI